MKVPYRESVLATAGLVSVWGLNLAAGNEPDLKNANAAVPAGGLERAQPSLLPNGEGKSAKFNGTSGRFEIANNANLEIGDTVSFEAWAKLSALGALRYIFDLGLNSGQLGIENTNKAELGKAGTSNVAESSTLVGETTHHIAVTKTGATRKVYVDAVDVTTLVANKTFEASNGTKTIGSWHLGTLAFFAGWLQYVAVYNVALTAAVVAEHFAAASLSTGSRAVAIGRRPVVNPGPIPIGE